ncbi:hypothetical protein ACHQM5_004004 [Ranunculus cassubicifolius]
MVQIGGRRKKKKGRPLKPDLDRRLSYDPGVSSRRESEVPRRSTRTRNLTYNEDSFYDDLYDEEDEHVDNGDDDDDDEEISSEDERRREKKVKLVVKIPDNKKRVDSVSRNGGGGRRRSGGGEVSAPESSSEYGEDDKPFKKRKIDESEDDRVDGDDYDNEESDVAKTVRSRNHKKNGVVKRLDSIIQPQGKLFESARGVPLPERRQLEFILDRLQKKDVYSVYAEPVDPEELPDYHDVIEHPMDFGTIRKKLANGTYTTLEQFEHDVGLISTNAMQYNAPETVYFRQARSIQELARKKFGRLRLELQSTAVEPKPEETIKTNSVVKKPLKKPSCKPIQEPLGSDFSSGATLATAPNFSTLSDKTQATAYEKPSTVDLHFDGNSSVTESKPEKTEEQISGKGVPLKLARKPVVLDENRRATYNNSSQPIVRTESMCTIFESEKVELTSVGLHVDNSYARSLARFAATLGPVAWKVASVRIEQALPGGVKFGRGWVGQYEPLPTPVLMIEKQPRKLPQLSLPAKSANSNLSSKSANSNLSAKSIKVRESEPRPASMQMNRNQTQWQPGKCSQSKSESRNNKMPDGASVSKKDTQLGFRTASSSGPMERDFASPNSERNPTQWQPGKCSQSTPEPRNDKSETQLGSRTANSSGSMERHFINPNSDAKMGFVGVSGSKPIMNTMRPELHRSYSDSGNPKENTYQKQPEQNSERRTSRLMEVVSTNKNLVQTDGRLPNGNASVSSSNYQGNGMPFGVNSNHPTPRAAVYFPQVNHDQGLSDPVQMMRMLAEKTQNNSKSLNFAAMDMARSTPSNPSTRRDDSSGAASAAARAWMTLGAGNFKAPENISVSPRMQIAATSLYNSSRENHPQSEVPVTRDSLQGKTNNFPPQMFLPQSARTGDELRFQNNRQQMGLGFPQQLVTTDLSRFQMQTPWQGLQPIKKQDTLPPDLNISFQSSGSPRQSNQPDLALQL